MASERDIFLDPDRDILGAGLSLRGLEKNIQSRKLVDRVFVLEHRRVNVDFPELLGVGDRPVPHPIVLRHDGQRGRHELQWRAPVGYEGIGRGMVEAEPVLGEEKLPRECAHGFVVEIRVCEFDLRVSRDVSYEERVHQDLGYDFHGLQAPARLHGLSGHVVRDVRSAAHTEKNTPVLSITIIQEKETSDRRFFYFLWNGLNCCQIKSFQDHFASKTT